MRRAAAVAALLLAAVAAAAWISRRGPEAAPPAPPSASATPGTPPEVLGRRIYEQGLGVSGEEIQAVVGVDSVVSARTAPCAGCHGDDGRGKEEAGVAVPDIRWASLTRPYEVTANLGRRRPPYDGRLFVRAVTMGVDAGNTRLGDVMPRYRLTLADAAALEAYVKVLERAPDPGIDAAAVRVAALLPAARADVAAPLRRYLDEAAGPAGIYGRRIDLRVLPLPAPGDPTRAAALRAFLDRERPFAVAGAFFGDDDAELLATLDARGVPVFGAVAAVPREPPGRRVFFLYGGVIEEARALFVLFAERGGPAVIAVVHEDSPAAGALAQAVERAWTDRGGAPPVDVPLPPGADGWRARASELALGRAGAVLFLGPPGAARVIFEASAKGGRRALFLMPASAGALTPAGPTGEGAFAAFPVPPSEQKPEVAAVVAGARVLVEALRRAGRDPTRAALVAAAEGIHGLDTGLGPPLSYGPVRRIGALGAYVVALGARDSPPPRWIPLE